MEYLARSPVRDILALSARLPASNFVFRPGPIRTTALATEDINIRRRARHGTCHSRDREVCDRDAGGRGSSRTSVLARVLAFTVYVGGILKYLVVLLNNNAIFRNPRKCDIFIGNPRDRTCSSRDGLNANTVLGVLDC
jgi:hypothetical protein